MRKNRQLIWLQCCIRGVWGHIHDEKHMNQNDVWEQTRPTVKANMNISSYLQNSVQWLQQPHKHDQEADGSVNELEMVERHGEHSTGEPATRHEQARDLSGGAQ